MLRCFPCTVHVARACDAKEGLVPCWLLAGLLWGEASPGASACWDSATDVWSVGGLSPFVYLGFGQLLLQLLTTVSVLSRFALAAAATIVVAHVGGLSAVGGWSIS